MRGTDGVWRTGGKSRKKKRKKKKKKKKKKRRRRRRKQSRTEDQGRGADGKDGGCQVPGASRRTSSS